MAWVEEGAHDSTPQDSTQGQSEQRSTEHNLPCPVHTSTNVNFIRSGEACFKPTSRVWHTSDNFFFFCQKLPICSEEFLRSCRGQYPLITYDTFFTTLRYFSRRLPFAMPRGNNYAVNNLKLKKYLHIKSKVSDSLVNYLRFISLLSSFHQMECKITHLGLTRHCL